MFLNRIERGRGGSGRFRSYWRAEPSAWPGQSRASAAEAPVEAKAVAPAHNNQRAASSIFRESDHETAGRDSKPVSPMTLTGRVLDEQGKPVPGRRGSSSALPEQPALAAPALLGIGRLLADARTDAEGRYRIDGVRGFERHLL